MKAKPETFMKAEDGATKLMIGNTRSKKQGDYQKNTTTTTMTIIKSLFNSLSSPKKSVLGKVGSRKVRIL